MRMFLVVLALCVGQLRAANAVPEGFELILLDGFEDCPLAYFDADLDGFGGDADVRIVCGEWPAGFVLIGGDCDDSSAAINPAALEMEPDAQFVDENCDGVDGNTALAIFVALPGSTAVDCGTRLLPCALAVAQARAQAAGRTQAYLQMGDYPGTLRLAAGAATLALFGGYDANWQRASRDTHPSRIMGATVTAVGAVGVEVVGGDYRFSDMFILAPDAVQRTASGDGLGSYAVRAFGAATLGLVRVTVSAGAGASGAAGANGSGASQVAAATGGLGGDGDEPVIGVCDDSSRGLGGSGGVNASCALTNGGGGGNGGTRDTDCSFPFDLVARPGGAGADAAQVSGIFGQGGDGGSGGTLCGATGAGTPGRIVDGAGGSTPSTARGTLSLAGTDSIWVGNPGQSGLLGTDGTGGGGGGGAGGCDVGTDSYGAGGGGGGAGGCRAPLQGSAGRAGGASIGVFVSGAVLNMSNSLIVRGNGGGAGAGGNGGRGQPGGAGGPIGAHPGGAAGGLGGAGARGGHSGAGSGGAGGLSVGVLSFMSVSTVSATAFTAGAGGAGGNGGTVGVPGAAGPVGVLAGNFTCAAASGC